MQVATSLAIRRTKRTEPGGQEPVEQARKTLSTNDLYENMAAEALPLLYDGHDRSRSAGSDSRILLALVLPRSCLLCLNVAALRSSSS